MGKKKGTINVSGMSISDIMNLPIEDFNKMGESDLRRITSRLVSAGNKRIRLLEKRGINSPAMMSLGTDTKFSTKLQKNIGKDQRVNKLRQEFSRVRNFLSLKTSTARGYNEYIKELKDDLRSQTGLSKKEINKINLNEVYSRLHKMQERGIVPVNVTGLKGGSKGSIQARNYLIQQMNENPNLSEENIVDMMTTKSREFYEIEEETGESEI